MNKQDVNKQDVNKQDWCVGFSNEELSAIYLALMNMPMARTSKLFVPASCALDKINRVFAAQKQQATGELSVDGSASLEVS